MKKRMLPAVFVALIAICASAAQAPRYLIAFEKGVAPERRAAILRELGATLVDDLPEIDVLAVELSEDRTFSALAEQASSVPEILAVEEDVRRMRLLEASVFQTPFPSFEAVRAALSAVAVDAKRPTFALPRGVNAAEVPWGVARVNAPAAWAVTQGEGVKVAVIDTGIDCTHADLKANCAGGYNALDSKQSSTDDSKRGHGTHVAGTIAAAWDGRGVVGVAPRANLYAVKVLDSDGSSGLTSILKGLIWCGYNRMDVANISFGFPTGTIFMRAALRYAAARGVVVFAAAGNDGGAVNYPGAYPETIAVAALGVDETIADFSSRGSQVDFIAPGENVRSSVPGGYDVREGTSMATPHMTGLGALAVARGAHGIDEVRAALTRAAVPIPGLPVSEQGAGVVDAAQLVR